MRWSVVVPYFNERDYLPATLASLIAQQYRPFRLILVDNASTDGSVDLARDLLKDADGIAPVYLHEPRPGKINALDCGLAHVDTAFVAFCDADTFYPCHYLARCDQVFAASKPDVVAVMAGNLSGPPTTGAAWRRQIKTLIVSKILTTQAHTGGFGQTFRTAALRRAGGYASDLWPFVLEDHEVMQRVFKQGRAQFDFDLWCTPSNRRADRSKVDWTLAERLLYHATPFALKEWYFYSFLARRFSARGLCQMNLREKSWVPDETSVRS
jgi:glycosyltransferase involved in cell wall biosynthesis